MSRLDKAHWASDDKLHFCCPICGDSKTDPDKTRGGILLDGNRAAFNCFNCGASGGLGWFLMQLDYELFREFKMIRLKSTLAEKQIDLNSRKPEPKIEVDYPNLDRFDLTSVLNLDNMHDAVQYLKSRHIPKGRWNSIYFTKDFTDIASAYSSTKADFERPALVFPLKTVDDKIYGFQSRYMTGKFRYQSAIIDKSIPKMIGMDRIDLSKKIHMFEGFFDSCFVPNGVAALDSSLYQRANEITEFTFENTVLWYDNEPFNKQIMKMKREAIEAGYTVVFYPTEFTKRGKDLNDVVMNTPIKERQRIMKKIQFASGMKAMLKHIENTR